MQPIIKTNAWYTLVTAKNEVINASWCKQQLARILKKSTDTIILFDVTGSYAVLVLDHDRLIPGQVPMAVKQYKSTPEGFVLAHGSISGGRECCMLTSPPPVDTLRSSGSSRCIRSMMHVGISTECWSRRLTSTFTSSFSRGVKVVQ